MKLLLYGKNLQESGLRVRLHEKFDAEGLDRILVVNHHKNAERVWVFSEEQDKTDITSYLRLFLPGVKIRVLQKRSQTWQFVDLDPEAIELYYTRNRLRPEPYNDKLEFLRLRYRLKIVGDHLQGSVPDLACMQLKSLVGSYFNRN